MKIKVTEANIKEVMEVLSKASWVSEQECCLLYYTRLKLYKMNGEGLITHEQMVALGEKYDSHDYGDMAAWWDYPLDWHTWRGDHIRRSLPLIFGKWLMPFWLYDFLTNVIFLVKVGTSQIWNGMTRDQYIFDDKDSKKIKAAVGHLVYKDAEEYCYPTAEYGDIDRDDHDETGPFGGAFRDEQDYITWREGSGFCDFTR